MAELGQSLAASLGTDWRYLTSRDVVRDMGDFRLSVGLSSSKWNVRGDVSVWLSATVSSRALAKWRRQHAAWEGGTIGGGMLQNLTDPPQPLSAALWQLTSRDPEGERDKLIETVRAIALPWFTVVAENGPALLERGRLPAVNSLFAIEWLLALERPESAAAHVRALLAERGFRFRRRYRRACKIYERDLTQWRGRGPDATDLAYATVAYGISV